MDSHNEIVARRRRKDGVMALIAVGNVGSDGKQDLDKSRMPTQAVDLPGSQFWVLTRYQQGSSQPGFSFQPVISSASC